MFRLYRYTGKERDEETGLYYHGARYYIPWLGRWSACDPMEAKYAGMSPYNYAMNNPVMMNDPSGADPVDPCSDPCAIPTNTQKPIETASPDPDPPAGGGRGAKIGDSILGYPQLRQGSGLISEAVDAYRGTSKGADISEDYMSATYNRSLAKFEQGGEFQNVKLSYEIASQAQINRYNERPGEPPPDATFTPGTTVLLAHMKSGGRPLVLGRDTSNIDPNDIESISIKIVLNGAIDNVNTIPTDQFGKHNYATITLNHELTMHALRLAKIISDGGPMEGILRKLAGEDQINHHNSDYLNATSTYNQVNNEVAAFKDLVGRGRGSDVMTSYYSTFTFPAHLSGDYSVPSNTQGNTFRIFVNNVAAAAMRLDLRSLAPTLSTGGSGRTLLPGGVLTNFQRVILRFPR